ncbi:unnamed protein product [Paramecium octaurelia]|uniref:Uncharacterized protein n=1 Tax=Paramecium octaurelia TaxID=43137 RepID=A0A8S1UU16_PAROT|nr:unnamed protein product [Paramecium octaurelia]
MSDEEEEVEEEEEEEDQEEQEEQEPQKQENDELNEFRKYNSHSSYANMHKYPKHNNDHNPLAYYYQRQIPIPYQPSQYWVDRVQYHQQEIDRAKQVLLNVQKPQPNMYNYGRSLNYQPNNSPLPQRVQIESQRSQNYNPSIPPNQPQYHFESRDFNRSPQPYNPNPSVSKYNPYPAPAQKSYPPPSQQNYYPPPQNELLNQQFSGNPTMNPYYQPYSPPYPNYYPPPPFAYVPPPYDFQQDLMKEYPKVNPLKSKQVQTEAIPDTPQLPTGVSQYQQEKPQAFSQQNIAPTQALTETELEYIEFLRFKEFNQKQQQQIDDQDFQDFQEFRKLKQLQLFKQTVDREEEKRSLTDLYKRKNRQVYSEQEFKSQLDKKRDYQQFQQAYKKPLQQETNLEIDRAINALMRSQTGTNKEFFK